MKKIKIFILLILSVCIAKSQNVGISDNTAFNPSYMLHIRPSAAYGNDLFSVQNNTGKYYLHVKLNGNLGIGTNNPQHPLDLQWAKGGNRVARLWNTSSAAGSDGLLISTNAGDAGSYILNCYSNGSSKMFIRSDGNVGIGTNNPTERLHLVGNFRFSGALMPNNLPGTTDKVLTSQGAGVAPTWANPTAMVYSNTYVVSSTASVVAGALTQVPGLTRTVTLASNAIVWIYTDGGVQTTCTTNEGTLIDMMILNNGAWLPQGGFKRLDVQNASNYTGGFQYWSMGAYVFLVAGTYTFTVNTQLNGGCGSATVGGNNTSVLEGILIVQVIYQ